MALPLGCGVLFLYNVGKAETFNSKLRIKHSTSPPPDGGASPQGEAYNNPNMLSLYS